MPPVENRNVIVTNEAVSSSFGFEGDSIEYTATVLDSIGLPLPSGFVANLLRASIILLGNQPFNNSVYDQGTGLLSLIFAVPPTIGSAIISLNWLTQSMQG